MSTLGQNGPWIPYPAENVDRLTDMKKPTMRIKTRPWSIKPASEGMPSELETQFPKRPLVALYVAGFDTAKYTANGTAYAVDDMVTNSQH